MVGVNDDVVDDVDTVVAAVNFMSTVVLSLSSSEDGDGDGDDTITS